MVAAHEYDRLGWVSDRPYAALRTAYGRDLRSTPCARSRTNSELGLPTVVRRVLRAFWACARGGRNRRQGSCPRVTNEGDTSRKEVDGMKKIKIRKAGSVRLTTSASLYGGPPCDVA